MPYFKLSGCSRPWASIELEIAEDLAARSVGDDPAGVEQDGPTADLQHHLEVVGRDELGAAKPVDSWMNRRRPRGSRLADGSSRTSTEGPHASTPARQTRFRSPKLR